ncbi:hypothetical protein QZQ97_08355 [Serratia sp. root2]|uniref:hypothetical protein n=1 Tax=Serratia sp. root2 TaxID=3059676 RepID=UPI002892901C|nr:hypothetical protein [Serratia sp. root2]MDT3250951.1 hypothetical protein [Serratia sp. root2]
MMNISQDGFETDEKNIIKKIFITINIDGVARRIMRFELRKGDDVALLLKHASHFRDLGESNPADCEIKQQRYSFHRSMESQEQINFIKHTFEKNNGEVINTHVVTPVIKDKSGFVQVYSHRVPNLTPERYDMKKLSKGSVEENLGEWDVKSSSLFLSVYVGSASLDVPKINYSSNVRSFVISDFRFLIIWSYLLGPAHNSGTLQHRMTMQLDDDSIIGQEPGIGVEKAVKQANESFWLLANEFAAIIHKELDVPYEKSLEMFELTGFIKDARRFSRERNELMQRMHDAGTFERYLSIFKSIL